MLGFKYQRKNISDSIHEIPVIQVNMTLLNTVVFSIRSSWKRNFFSRQVKLTMTGNNKSDFKRKSCPELYSTLKYNIKQCFN